VFCPVCEAEFVEGIPSCPDDLVDLVERLPQKRRGYRARPPTAKDMVHVLRFPGEPTLREPRAEFLRTALEENGIEVWVTGEYQTPGPYGTILDPPVIEILVPRPDLQRAREIIAEVEGPPAAGDGD